jgi:hypothetical protein
MPAPTTEVDARRYLERMLQWNVAPTLSVAEVDDLYVLALITDEDGNEPDSYTPWKPSTAYGFNVLAVPTVRNGFFYRVVAPGTSAISEPLWPLAVGDSMADGSVGWITEGEAPYTAAFNLATAAAEGWEWKASKVAGSYDVKAGSVDAKRQQVFEMCKQQALYFRGLASPVGSSTGVGWINVTTAI